MGGHRRPGRGAGGRGSGNVSLAAVGSPSLELENGLSFLEEVDLVESCLRDPLTRNAPRNKALGVHAAFCFLSQFVIHVGIDMPPSPQTFTYTSDPPSSVKNKLFPE